MIIVFEKGYLKELYEEGKSKSKKYRFQKEVINQYKRTIDKLRAADAIEDLFPLKSLNYEKLIGTELESVRVNNQYRIEFISYKKGEAPNVVTICSIKELSNHYK